MEEKKVKKSIGAKIRIAREEKKYTQKELAKILKINSSHISRLESGFGGYSPQVLVPIAEALEKPLHYFYEPIGLEGSSQIRDGMSVYGGHNRLESDLDRICSMLMEHPEVQPKVMEYLLSYYSSGKGHLSRVGGVIDALTPQQIEEIIPLLIKKLRVR